MSEHKVAAHFAPRQQLLHWFTALLMFAILPVAWVTVSVVEESRPFFLWMDIHELLGMTLLAVTVLRLALRISDGAPSIAAGTPRWLLGVSLVVQRGLFLMLLVMPVSGYLWANGHGHEVAPFHLVHFPRVAFARHAIGDLAERVHVACQWILYLLITLHVAGISYHVFVLRDGLLDRMLPRQTSPGLHAVSRGSPHSTGR